MWTKSTKPTNSWNRPRKEEECFTFDSGLITFDSGLITFDAGCIPPVSNSWETPRKASQLYLANGEQYFFADGSPYIIGGNNETNILKNTWNIL